MIVGPKMMQEYDLLIGNGPTQYKPQRDPRVSNEFATVFLAALAALYLTLVSDSLSATFEFGHKA